ncbi:MAG: aminotransferase class I/II-fold pyridoxal phosphate-dependent enzyme [Clostridiales bacterium]|nr:aminotransferase class I/II-fold pyridoxal phosphate-dependent enzyme [Clostridiales bacterium]
MSDARSLSQALLHTGDGQFAKRMKDHAAVPEALPVYMTSVFAFDDVPSVDAIYEHEAEGYIYSRMRHPNADAVAEILSAADGGEDALVFSSGMAAITLSILSLVQAGDHIVASPVLYGGVRDFLEKELRRLGVRVTFVDLLREDVEAALRPETKLIYTETLCNPLLEVPDLRRISSIAHAHGLPLLVDNTFATPVVAQPISLGADLVLYSATKYLGGHSDIVSGAAVGSRDLIERIRPKLVLYGAVSGAQDCWLLARSLRTLQLRVTRHSQNALRVARFLEEHPKVEKVYYPGLASSPDHARAQAQFRDGLYGGMLTVDLAGGERAATDFVAALESIKYVPSLAGTATTLSYPAKTSHRFYTPEALEKAGITMGQLRFSIGLEDPDEIIAEMARALDAL